MYKLGNHYLLCGDATNEDDVNKLIQHNQIDLVYTDPPYNVEYTGGQISSGVFGKNKREMIMNDDVDIYKDLFYILSKFANSACYIWFAGTKGASVYKYADLYGDIHSLIIWVKDGGYGAINANYKQKHEPLLYWKPKGKKLNFVGATNETTIWEQKRERKNKLHPTQKPIELAQKAILNHQCKTILDLFGGSGSTLIAAELTKKQCFMMELDPAYCDVIIERWENLTRQKAELING